MFVEATVNVAEDLNGNLVSVMAVGFVANIPAWHKYFL